MASLGRFIHNFFYKTTLAIAAILYFVQQSGKYLHRITKRRFLVSNKNMGLCLVQPFMIWIIIIVRQMIWLGLSFEYCTPTSPLFQWFRFSKGRYSNRELSGFRMVGTIAIALNFKSWLAKLIKNGGEIWLFVLKWFRLTVLSAASLGRLSVQKSPSHLKIKMTHKKNWLPDKCKQIQIITPPYFQEPVSIFH